jgi:hypothetical protein
MASDETRARAFYDNDVIGRRGMKEAAKRPKGAWRSLSCQLLQPRWAEFALLLGPLGSPKHIPIINGSSSSCRSRVLAFARARMDADGGWLR